MFGVGVFVRYESFVIGEILIIFIIIYGMHCKFLMCVRSVYYESSLMFNFFLHERTSTVCVVMNVFKGLGQTFCFFLV